MRSFFMIVLAGSFLLNSACSSAPSRTEPDNLFWPLPPQTPRIKYVKSIYSEDDIGREYSLREKLFGKSYTDQLRRPYGIFARRGKVYVTDIGAMRVWIYDLIEKRLRVLGEEGAIQLPSAITADADGNVYVADAAKSKIAVYDRDGRYSTAFILENVKPVALAFNEALRRLYVVDRIGHKIVVLDTAGKMLFEFGGQGVEEGRFNMPLAVDLDKGGNVHVLDNRNFRVQTFDPDGKFLRTFGSVGDRPGFFSNPKGLALDSEGHIYVTDAAFSNFQIFEQSGSVLLYVGKLGPDPGQLYLPAGIAIDENDYIYIADQLNSRVQVFQYLKER
ncbi:MAG: hypothetical protein A2010_08200 [Nitrospirae bacterium GWD2_57_9]|nr:MAG: hypothetical protein A2010_08200 [Nitrospirae bacterium GWD2_57_9]